MRLTSDVGTRLSRISKLPPGRDVLSVYLRIDPGMALDRGYRARAMDVLRGARERLSGDPLAAFETEASRVLDFVRDPDFHPEGRSLVIFSSRPRRLWEVIQLQAPVPCVAVYQPRAFLTPLFAATDEFSRVAVVLADEERARLFIAELGEIASESHLRDAVPRKQRQGGWSAFKYQRDREMHIREHLSRVAGQIGELASDQGFERLVVGGSDDVTSLLLKLLPKTLRSRLAGTFRAEMFATDDEVVKRGLEVAERAEREEEERLVHELVDSAFAGGKAALGWEETLGTLSQGRVQRLVLAASRLTAPEAEQAVVLSSETDAEIEIVRGAAEDVLAPHGGIGAVLRY